jgi:hypothetical protein
VGGTSDPVVTQSFVRCHAFRRVDGQTALDKGSGRQRDAAPVFEGCEGVVGDENGLHLFEVAVSVEGRVAAEEEVSDDADGPNIAGKGLAGEECHDRV